MPALVNSRFGESGMSDEDGTMVCPFDLKKSKKLWRISADVIVKTLMRLNVKSGRKLAGKPGAKRVGSFFSESKSHYRQKTGFR